MKIHAVVHMELSGDVTVDDIEAVRRGLYATTKQHPQIRVWGIFFRDETEIDATKKPISVSFGAVGKYLDYDSQKGRVRYVPWRIDRVEFELQPTKETQP